MRAFLLSIPLLLLLAYRLPAQSVPLRTVCKLPGLLEETSGLEITEGYTFWSHNDSGGDPALYLFDSTGTLIRSLSIGNSTNEDWEELAQDDAGNFYIGDFGNNDNKRKNLRILKIPNPLAISAETTSAEFISISYAEQTKFPPSDAEKNFDAEAMFWYQGSLYLFSKNRTDPFTGIVYMYKISDAPGTYEITRVGSFDTGEGSMLENWITSADISPDGSRMILLTQGKAWLFTGFSGDDFFGGDVQLITFPHLTQKEAVCFATNTGVYFTDELVAGIIGGNLYYLDLNDVTGGVDLPEPEGTLMHAFPNPFETTVTMSYINTQEPPESIGIYNTLGERIYHTPLSDTGSSDGTVELRMPYSAMPPGMYLAVLHSGQSVETLRLIRR